MTVTALPTASTRCWRPIAHKRTTHADGYRLVTPFDFVLIALAALAAGMVNALAGGGTLITFPMLTAIGIPAVVANITNTVALCPGYFGATLAQANDLRGQERRLWLLVPTAVAGGIVGGLLLLNTNERLFGELVPYLILLAAGLLAFQTQLRKWVVQRTQHAGAGGEHLWIAAGPVFLAAIYGGYFGAGLSVIVLATLGLVLEDTLTRLNALKQIISFSVNTAAALFFLFSGQVLWPAALVMAVAALAGGALGGRLAGRIQPNVLRWIVVSVGVIVAIIYLIR
ncbi:MAG: sulfite exporter TauE/SafE family protein [Caldilineaceae bacterium]|nr:sulfite exporter TauE/SafE family protein [Caldilineaceae bacterium]